MLHNVFIWFFDQENVGLDPQIMILHEVISEISDFEAAILKNGRNQQWVPDVLIWYLNYDTLINTRWNELVRPIIQP